MKGLNLIVPQVLHKIKATKSVVIYATFIHACLFFAYIIILA